MLGRKKVAEGEELVRPSVEGVGHCLLAEGVEHHLLAEEEERERHE